MGGPDLELVEESLIEFGARNYNDFGITTVDSYSSFGEALLHAIESILAGGERKAKAGACNKKFDEYSKRCWRMAYKYMAMHMIKGAQKTAMLYDTSKITSKTTATTIATKTTTKTKIIRQHGRRRTAEGNLKSCSYGCRRF